MCTIDGRLFRNLMELIISSFLIGYQKSYSTEFCGLCQLQPLFLTRCTAHILGHRFHLCGNQLDSLHTFQCCYSLFFQSDKLNERKNGNYSIFKTRMHSTRPSPAHAPRAQEHVGIHIPQHTP